MVMGIHAADRSGSATTPTHSGAAKAGSRATRHRLSSRALRKAEG